MEGRTYIVYHKERPLSTHAEEFLKLLRGSNREKTKTIT